MKYLSQYNLGNSFGLKFETKRKNWLKANGFRYKNLNALTFSDFIFDFDKDISTESCDDTDSY